jgi:hypothetical protein
MLSKLARKSFTLTKPVLSSSDFPNERTLVRRLVFLLLCFLAFPTAAQADFVQAPATEDSWVRSDQPSSTAGASDDELWTQVASGSLPTERGFLKFNVTGIPAGSTINGVSLNFALNAGKSYAGTSNGPRISATTCGWAESTLTYSNAPAAGTTLGNLGALPANFFGAVGLQTSLVPGNGTACIRLDGEGDDMGMWSSEAPSTANRPSLRVDYSPPTAPPVDTDGDGVPDSTDQCDTQPGPASNNGCPVVTPPPTGGPEVPAGAVALAAGTQEWNGTGSFTTSQCPHAIPYQTDGTNTWAHFERRGGEPQSAGGNRCEQQSSTYIGKGLYLFKWRARYFGFPPGSWATGRQWHENTSDGGGPVYLAMFHQNSRWQIDGQFVSPGTQSVFPPNIGDWHTYTARVNFANNSTGYGELWIDDTYIGRTTSNITATPSNSYDKYGVYTGSSTATLGADYDFARAWKL